MKQTMKNNGMFMGVFVLAVAFLLATAGPAAAAQVFYDLQDPVDSIIGGQVLDGTYIVSATYAAGLELYGGFSGWGDLSGYTNLSATLTFTWHDDHWNYNSFSNSVWMEEVDPNDENITYVDPAQVELDGELLFQNVEVGLAGSEAPTVYQHVLTDLSVLDDNAIDYHITAIPNAMQRRDFLVDSVAFEITGNPVPVPAAVWLLGSGLLGLVGIRRRKA
jgi:hypothetical protein